jgi:hypothetical protein
MAASQPNRNYRHLQVREKNPNWQGGRLVASNGYVLIRVGVDHHLADVRGYAYEHRIVAEQKIGRRLESGESVHHVNGNKQVIRPENLEVMAGVAEHLVHHRKAGSNRRLPGQENELVLCKCGCGESFLRFDGSGRPREYVSGHNGCDLAGMILLYLEVVPESGRTRYIAEFLDANERSVCNALCRLRKAGVVERADGEWRLAQ